MSMIELTVIAAEKIKQKIAEENKDTEIPETAGLRLKLNIVNEKCRGFLLLESTPKKNDQVFESRGLNIFIDPDSQRYQEEKYAKDILIYWIGDSTGGGFAIENPNMKYSCGHPQRLMP